MTETRLGSLQRAIYVTCSIVNWIELEFLDRRDLTISFTFDFRD